MGEFGANGEISQLLLEHVPAAVALFDREMRYVGFSRRWLTDYGLEGEDIIGRSHYEVFPELSERDRNLHRRVLAGETLSGDLEALKRIDGSISWMQWELVPWHRQTGEVGGLIMFTQVLNDLVRSKQLSQTLDTELNLLIDSAERHAICLLDSEGKVLIWNAGAERMYGWTADEIVGKSYELMFESADREAGVPGSHLAQARHTGTTRARSWRVRKDGSRFLADCSISRILDDDGTLVGFGKVAHDTTEENAQMLQSEASEAQLRSILDTVPDAMITIDEQGIIESFSAAAERLFGYSADEVCGRNVSMLMPEPHRTGHDGYLAHYRATGVRRVMGAGRRVPGLRKDGSVFPHELFVGEALGGGRRVFTGFVRDLTEREKADSRFQELQHELIHVSRVSAIGAMATALAHELNQPLTVIANSAQSSAALLTADDDRAMDLVREALVETGREALRAGEIIQRLREFIARGELDRSIMSPYDLVTQASTLGSVGIKCNDITCTVAVPPDLRPILVDRVHIQQVLLNLIRNAFEALEYSGVVVIAADVYGSMLRISVTDNGPGIRPGREEALFEPFVSSKAKGMGLGLAICRTIIQAHGGRLWCENAPNGGAAFHFTVPFAETDDG